MENNVVTVSNTFVQASYSLNLIEKRLILACLSKIDNNISKLEGRERDTLETINSDTYYKLSVIDYAELYNITYEKAKDELVIAIDKLYSREVRYTDKNNNTIRTRWISSAIEYDKVTHSISIAWAIGIIPLISELRGNFTSYKMRFLAGLSSSYSIRWYEIFIMELAKSHKHEIIVELSIDTIRTMFELQNKYALFGDFVKRVIDGPLKEINETKIGNIQVSIYDKYGNKMYIKRGKQVVGIKFKVSWRTTRNIKPIENKQEKQLRLYGKILDE